VRIAILPRPVAVASAGPPIRSGTSRQSRGRLRGHFLFDLSLPKAIGEDCPIVFFVVVLRSRDFHAGRAECHWPFPSILQPPTAPITREENGRRASCRCNPENDENEGRLGDWGGLHNRRRRRPSFSSFSRGRAESYWPFPSKAQGDCWGQVGCLSKRLGQKIGDKRTAQKEGQVRCCRPNSSDVCAAHI
jgi:hypothetical protein